MENEEPVGIYNVKVNNESRKAMDLVGLKRFLEERKLKYSILNLDPNHVESDDTVINYLAKAASDTLADLELSVDKSLGLYQEPEVEEEPAPKEEPKEPEEDKSKVEDPDVLKDDTPEPDPAPKPKEDDEEITI